MLIMANIKTISRNCRYHPSARTASPSERFVVEYDVTARHSSINSYNASQLEEILSKRVEQAFKPGTVPDEVIEEIAETVAENSGDCREALEKLLRVGRKADRNGVTEISKAHLSFEP